MPAQEQGVRAMFRFRQAGDVAGSVLICRGVPPWAPHSCRSDTQGGVPTEGRPYKLGHHSLELSQDALNLPQFGGRKVLPAKPHAVVGEGYSQSTLRFKPARKFEWRKV